MKKQWDVIELLSHSRHDWLNTIQLIKGNLALHRIDRVDEIIEKVVQQTKNETKLSNLGIPKLAEDFLTFNWEKHLYVIEFEVVGDILNLSKHEEDLSKWCNSFFNYLDTSCKQFHENHLLVMFQLLEEKKIIFDFHGHLNEFSKLKEWVKSNGEIMETCKVIETIITDTEVYITIELIER